jgi:hypothetical protein
MFTLDFYKKRISHFLTGFIQRDESTYREVGKKFKLSYSSMYRAAKEKKEITLNDIYTFATELKIPLSTFFEYLEEEKRGEINYKYPWEGEIMAFFCGISPVLRSRLIEKLIQLQRKHEGKVFQEYVRVMAKVADLSAAELELFTSLMGTLGIKNEKRRSA